MPTVVLSYLPDIQSSDYAPPLLGSIIIQYVVYTRRLWNGHVDTLFNLLLLSKMYSSLGCTMKQQQISIDSREWVIPSFALIGLFNYMYRLPG